MRSAPTPLRMRAAAIPSPRSSSEQQLKAELQLPCRRAGAGDDASCRTRDAVRTQEHALVRQREIRVIEQVEHLHTQLEPDTGRQRRVLLKGEIEVHERRTENGVA